jgi:uncharacterized protein
VCALKNYCNRKMLFTLVSMTGETNLQTLLQTMQPLLHQGEYVFCTVPLSTTMDTSGAIMVMREAEGLTLVLPRPTADALGLPYTCPMAWITLTVHSSLEAVGLTAAFAKALADAGISCNTVAGFYHDHLFVPYKDAGRAMEALGQLAGQA